MKRFHGRKDLLEILRPGLQDEVLFMRPLNLPFPSVDRGDWEPVRTGREFGVNELKCDLLGSLPVGRGHENARIHELKQAGGGTYPRLEVHYEASPCEIPYIRRSRAQVDACPGMAHLAFFGAVFSTLRGYAGYPSNSDKLYIAKNGYSAAVCPASWQGEERRKV